MSDEEEANIAKPLRGDSKVDHAAARGEEEGSGNSWGILDVLGAGLYLTFSILFLCAASLTNSDNFTAITFDDDDRAALNSVLEDLGFEAPRVDYPWGFMLASTVFFGLFLCTEMCTRCKHGCCAIISTLCAFVGNVLCFVIALMGVVPRFFNVTSFVLYASLWLASVLIFLFFAFELLTNCSSFVKIADSSFSCIASILVINCVTTVPLDETDVNHPANLFLAGSVFYVFSAVLKIISCCVSQ